MNRKLFLLTTFCCGFYLSAWASIASSDTTIVEFTDKGVQKRVTVLTEGGKDFKVPKVLNIENLLKEIGVDSAERKKTMVLIETGKADKDTLLVVSRDGRTIKIVAKNPFVESTSKTDTTRTDGDRWGTNKRETVEKNEEGEGEEEMERLGKKRFFSKSDFGIYLGVNNWTNNNPVSPNQETALRTGKSRYVALSFRKNYTFLNTESLDIALAVGPEIAWYNFMFQNDNVAKMVGNQVQFTDAGKRLSKSKLVMPYANLPILLNFGLEQSQLQIGLGGYVGYRFGGYTKTKDDNRNKERLKDSADYGMSDLFYGLTAEIGKRRGLKFFFRYDLTPMFKENQVNAKQLQAWSAGVRL